MKKLYTQKLVINDIEIEVSKKRIKNMHLSVLPPDGKVRISAPLYIKDEIIKNFAVSKIGWIKSKLVNLKTCQSKVSESMFQEKPNMCGEEDMNWRLIISV